jgi:hypothetical protein
MIATIIFAVIAVISYIALTIWNVIRNESIWNPERRAEYIAGARPAILILALVFGTIGTALIYLIKMIL